MKRSKREEFEYVIQDCRPALLKRAQRKVGGRDAADVVQQTYLTALTHPKWHEIENTEKWMMGVLDNTARDYKDKGSQLKRCDAIAEQLSFEQITALQSAASERDIVDAIAEKEEIAEKIKQIMKAMAGAGLTRSEDYVVLARLRGQENEEIARTLGLGRETVATYYSNAICKIRKKFCEND